MPQRTCLPPRRRIAANVTEIGPLLQRQQPLGDMHGLARLAVLQQEIGALARRHADAGLSVTIGVCHQLHGGGAGIGAVGLKYIDRIGVLPCDGQSIGRAARDDRRIDRPRHGGGCMEKGQERQEGRTFHGMKSRWKWNVGRKADGRATSPDAARPSDHQKRIFISPPKVRGSLKKPFMPDVGLSAL